MMKGNSIFTMCKVGISNECSKLSCVIDNDKAEKRFMKSLKPSNNPFFLVTIIIHVDYTKEISAYNGMHVWFFSYFFVSEMTFLFLWHDTSTVTSDAHL